MFALRQQADPLRSGCFQNRTCTAATEFSSSRAATEFSSSQRPLAWNTPPSGDAPKPSTDTSSPVRPSGRRGMRAGVVAMAAKARKAKGRATREMAAGPEEWSWMAGSGKRIC